MINKLIQVIHAAIIADDASYPDKQQLVHLMASVGGLTGDNRERIEKAWNAIVEGNTEAGSGRRSSRSSSGEG